MDGFDPAVGVPTRAGVETQNAKGMIFNFECFPAVSGYAGAVARRAFARMCEGGLKVGGLGSGGISEAA